MTGVKRPILAALDWGDHRETVLRGAPSSQTGGFSVLLVSWSNVSVVYHPPPGVGLDDFFRKLHLSSG